MKKIILFFLFFFLFSCGNGKERKPIFQDVLELPLPEVNLSIPEVENLMQSNISNLCVPLGTIDDLSSLNILSKVSQNLILKIIIPKDKMILFKDKNFSDELFKKIEKEVIKSISQQVKINALLFVIEDEKIPSNLESFKEFLKKLKPLNLSIGLGLPLFLSDKFKEKDLEEIDFAVIYAFGFPYPPSLDISLLNTYKLNSKETNNISFPIPFYFGVSLANGLWISSNGSLENYIIGAPLNRISKNPSFDYIGPNLNSTTHNPQHIFEAKANLEMGKFSLKKGNNLNYMLFSYDKAKDIIGAKSRFFDHNYLGRYYYYYSTEENEGVLNFNTWLSYLKAQILSPCFELQILREGGGFTLILINVTGLYSDFSTSKNYLEWEFKSGYFKEASVGDFSRFRFYLNEEEVMPVQAEKVRFYENFIAPFEVLRTGPIKVSGDIEGIFRISYLLPSGEQKIEILKFK